MGANRPTRNRRPPPLRRASYGSEPELEEGSIARIFCVLSGRDYSGRPMGALRPPYFRGGWSGGDGGPKNRAFAAKVRTKDVPLGAAPALCWY